jgi:hypothetical protein
MSTHEKEQLVDMLESELTAGRMACFNPFHAIPFRYLREATMNDHTPYYDYVRDCACTGWDWDEVKDLV